MTWCKWCNQKFHGDKPLFNHWDNNPCPELIKHRIELRKKN